jgi:hypothetical protein
MTASAVPRGRARGIASWSATRIRLVLLGYGAVLAILAVGWWAGSIPNSSVVMQGSRQTLVAKSIAVLNQGGPPLLATNMPYKTAVATHGFVYPANGGDDEGIYLYLPVAGHLLGNDNPLSLEKWFAILGMALIPLLYPLLFFVLFDSLAAAIVVPLVAVEGVRGLINTDLYWIGAWILMLGLPIVYVAAKHRARPWLCTALLGGAALLASFATSVRAQAGLGVAGVAAIVGLVCIRGWWRKAAAVALVVVAYLSIMTFAFAGVRAYRNHVSHMPASSLPYAHPLWHPTYLGLGYLPNKWGIRWEDAVGLAAARKVDPHVVYLSPHYEQILRHLYFTAVKSDPGWALHLYGVKLATLTHAGFSRNWLAILLAPVLLAFGPAARRLRFQLLLLLPCLVLAIIPAELTIPSYNQGFLGGLALLSFLVVGAVLLDADPLIRRIPNLQLTRLVDGQPASATLDEARSAGRQATESVRRWKINVPVLVAVVVATALAVAAAASASRVTASTRTTIFFYSKATPVLNAPQSARVVQSWDGAAPLGSWSTQNGAATTQTSDGVQIGTAASLVDPQFVSPAVQLPAGRYGVVVSGDISSGGMFVQAVPDGGSVLPVGFFWHGQTGLDSPGMYGSFTLPKPASMHLVLVNWARAPGPSNWTLRRVKLLRLPATRG